MTESNQRLADLVTVDADFKPSVQLPTDFDHVHLNERLIKSYIPTSDSIALFTEIARSLNPNSTERARTLVGTYGTGKSDMLLMICNYLSRPVDDPVMQSFYQRLKAVDPVKHDIIYQQRANRPPFLIVLLQADPDTRFPGFVLHGLNHALAQQGLADVMAETKYDAARQQLERWQSDQHPLFQTFYRTLQENEGKEIAGLLAELASPQADLVFPAFERVFKKVTGTEFNIYGYSQPHEAFIKVTRLLHERGTHSGVLLVCDEFTEFLRRYERAIDQQSSEVDSETMAVQNVAERSTSSGAAQLHFLVASLESFAAASMESKSGQARKAIERVGGRFKQHSLAVQASEELIKGAICKQPGVLLLPNRQRDELLDIASAIWKQQGHNREWVRDTIVEGCFPLHPLTTYALPLLNRNVAQSQRTMFQFLKSDEGLMGFVNRENLKTQFSDWHTLLTLDVLFDYFHESIATRKPDLMDAYNHSLQSLHTANVDIRLAERVLKTITLCEVVTPDEILTPTRSRLQQALNLPAEASDDLQTALTTLEQVEAIYPPETEHGLYSLPMPGRVSVVRLRQKVRDQSHTLATRVETLQAKHSAPAVEARMYNQQRGTHRELTAFYVGVEALSQPARLKRDLASASDALLWYVVATSDTERATAQSAARELTRQHDHLVVAVPVVPLEILSALRDYEALTKVRNDPDVESSARAYLLDTGTIGKTYKTNLEQALTTLKDFRQWEWFTRGGSAHTVPGQQKVYEVASKLMEQLFPDTPPHQLGQHFKPGTPSTSLKKAVESIIKGDVSIAKTKKGQVESIVRASASSLGILKLDRTDGAFEIYTPDQPDARLMHSRKVWRLLHDNLAAGKSWAGIADTLRKPPYGLYDSLLLVYLAAFITCHADSIEIAYKKAIAGRPNVDTDLLANLLARPQDYTLKFQPLSEAERRWLRGLVEQGLKRQAGASTAQGKSLRASVADQVQAWVKQLKLPLFVEHLEPAILQEIMPDIPQAHLAVALLLIQEKQNLDAVLMQDIPARLGAPADRTQWQEADVNELIARFAEVCSTLCQFPYTLLQYVERRIATCFGCEHLAAEEQWNAIYEWRQKKQIVNPETLYSPARSLFRLTNDPRGSIEQNILNEYAKTIVGINTDYQRWSSLDSLSRLEQEIEKVRQQIEAQWREAAPGEEVWLDGLASAASGRALTSASTGEVANHLVAWAAGCSWPACAATIAPQHLQRFYPDLEDTQQCQDVSSLLQRVAYDAAQWEAEVVETLAKQFGIQSWRKQEVQDALTRFAAALQRAAQFDVLLRQYVLTSTARLFADEQWSPGQDTQSSISDILTHWQEAHSLPEQNDLSEDARTLLRHIHADTTTTETLLLSTLPRAFADIGQAYQQWTDCQMLDHYLARVRLVVNEINAYVPLTYAEQSWLTGIVTKGLQQPLHETSFEQRRLLSIVAKHVHAWLAEQKLPQFSLTLGEAELRTLLPAVEEYVITSSRLLLNSFPHGPEHIESLLLDTLPASLIEETTRSADWCPQDTNNLLERFGVVCQLIRSLNEHIEHDVYMTLGSVFGVADKEDTTPTIVAGIRQWAQQHILLSGEKLSPNAEALYEALRMLDANPRNALLERLPKKIQEIRQPYNLWQDWQTRDEYIAVLREAAQEIEQRGHVGEATPRVRNLWEEFKQQYQNLTADEQRWLIKAFNEELRQ
jgi:hypothetical protein